MLPFASGTSPLNPRYPSYAHPSQRQLCGPVRRPGRRPGFRIIHRSAIARCHRDATQSVRPRVIPSSAVQYLAVRRGMKRPVARQAPAAASAQAIEQLRKLLRVFEWHLDNAPRPLVADLGDNAQQAVEGVPDLIQDLRGET